MNLKKTEETHDENQSEIFNELSKINSKIDDITDLISQQNEKNDENISKITELIKVDNDNIKKQIAKVNDNLLEKHGLLYSDLNKLVEAQDTVYKESRRYFFNGYESVLKEHLDPDFLFNLCYFNNISFLSYSPEENRMILKTDDDIVLSTNNHIWTLMEVNGLNEYIIPQLFYFDDFVVFDIGMNRAYASLKFANFDNCSKVYGFEIDEFTYQIALDNIKLNPKLENKIKTYNFGLSDEIETVDLYYIDGYDGLNTMIQDFTNIQPVLEHFEDKINVKQAEVKIASEVISDIIKSDNITAKKILKIDTEGAEYKIISDLLKSNLLSQMDVILGEGHNIDDNNFHQDLLNLGFVAIKLNIEEVTYSFAYVKKEYYKFWPNMPIDW
ncbi:FkbM family methyltransferase [Methanobrevibacter sp.]|uniref:FkbM family methyltransferase n=1 Tax=Methanobrevibacter sp. TaxID=66852 RepID=UPI003890FA2F